MITRPDPSASAVRMASWGRWESIVEYIEPLLPFHRHDPVLIFYLGFSWLKLGVSDFAVVYLQRAMQLKPRDLRISLTLAAVFLMRGQRDKAIGIYIDILEVYPEEFHALQAMKWIKKAANEIAFNEQEPGLPALKTVSRFFPDGGLPKSIRICIWVAASIGIAILSGLLLEMNTVWSWIWGF